MLIKTTNIKYFIITLLFLGIFSSTLYSQNSTFEDISVEDLSKEFDELFSDSQDSLDIFQLIDSLLAIEEPSSQISIRAGYSSRVTSAGRDFGVDQQGISPGISLYHKSGLYGDITGVWNSEFDPKYNLTVTTLGYLGNISPKLTYSISYDHSFFHTTDDTQDFPLTNAFSTSISADFKFLYTGLDYTFAFGNESAHRITWNITGYVAAKSFKPFNSITFLPTFSVLFGNQSITQSYFNVDRFEQIKNLTVEQLRNLARSGNYTQEEISTIILLRNLTNRDDLSSRQEETLNEFFTSAENIDGFGLMNYYISLPLSLTIKNFGILLSYNYNIPIELPGSDYNSKSNGYLSCTFSYNIGLKSSK